MDELVFKQLSESPYPVFIWGVGALSIEVTKRLEENRISIAGYFVDVAVGDASRKYGVKIDAGEVRNLEELEGQNQKIDVVVGHGHYEKRDMMQKKEFVHQVYVIGEPYLQYQIDRTVECMVKGRKEIGEISGYLADEASINALEAYYNFKATNDIEYLLRGDFFIDGMFELPELELGKSESYLDVGAWEGDTIEKFLEMTSGEYQYICGIEPEAENFRILEEKCRGWRDAEMYKIGVGNKEGSVFVCNDNKQSAYLREDAGGGGEMVQVKKLDAFLPEKKFTLMKISVAFSFLDILLGGNNRIQRDRPRLIVNVAADNRMTVFDTIRWIHDLNLGYKISLRFDLPVTTRLYLYAY